MKATSTTFLAALTAFAMGAEPAPAADKEARVSVAAPELPRFIETNFRHAPYGRIPAGWRDLIDRRPSRNWAVDGNAFLRPMLNDYTGLLVYDGDPATAATARRLTDAVVGAEFKMTEDAGCAFGIAGRVQGRDDYYLARFVAGSRLELLKIKAAKPEVLSTRVVTQRYRDGELWKLILTLRGDAMTARVVDVSGGEAARVDARDEEFKEGSAGLSCTTYAAASSFRIDAASQVTAALEKRETPTAAAAPNYPVVRPHWQTDELNTPFAKLTASYDVVVAGAGTGGWAAAVQAARMGARVLLLEETDWIGGQMCAAAVTTMDEDSVWMKFPVRERGLYREFHESMVDATTTRSIRTRSSPTTATPTSSKAATSRRPRARCSTASSRKRATARRVLDVSLRTRVVAVRKAGRHRHRRRPSSSPTSRRDSARTIACKVLIDATEYGDVIPLTGARYRVGNVTSDKLDPAALVQDHTWTAVVREYPGGVPEHLQIKSPPPGYEDGRAPPLQELSATTASCSGAAPGKGIKGHRALARLFRLARHGRRRQPAHRRAQRPAPHAVRLQRRQRLSRHRRDHRRPRAAPARRARGHLSSTLGALYYFQHELGVNWSLAEDEGYDTPYNRAKMKALDLRPDLEALAVHLPQQPYVRECRRIIGVQHARGRRPRRASRRQSTSPRPSRWATTSWTSTTARPRTPSSRTSTPANRRKGGGPFQVPFEVFIPEKLDGFLPAEKNISQSRLANGATRLQPITMLTGQAAGTIAALAVKQGVQPRALDPHAGAARAARRRLHAHPALVCRRAVGHAALAGDAAARAASRDGPPRRDRQRQRRPPRRQRPLGSRSAADRCRTQIGAHPVGRIEGPPHRNSGRSRRSVGRSAAGRAFGDRAHVGPAPPAHPDCQPQGSHCGRVLHDCNPTALAALRARPVISPRPPSRRIRLRKISMPSPTRSVLNPPPTFPHRDRKSSSPPTSSTPKCQTSFPGLPSLGINDVDYYQFRDVIAPPQNPMDSKHSGQTSVSLLQTPSLDAHPAQRASVSCAMALPAAERFGVRDGAHSSLRPSSSRRLDLARLSAALAAALLVGHSAQAATKTWKNTGTAWATDANWETGVAGSAPANDLSTDIALFNSATYTFQPTAPALRQVNAIISGDGATITGALTITTSTTTNRMAIGAGGILVKPASGTVSIGAAATQGVFLGTFQSWQNDSSSLLTVQSVANVSGSFSPVTLTLNGSGVGGTTIANVIADSGTAGGTTALIINTTGGATTLSGTNTFTGGVTLTQGTLILNNAKSLGAVGGAAFVINGGTIDSGTGTALTSNVPITIGGNFTYGGTNDLNLGTGAITNASNRTITLNGTAKTLTMSGIMTNSADSVQTTTVDGAGNTFSIGGYALTGAGSTAARTNVIDGTGNVNITGTVSDGVSAGSGLTYSGAGVLTLAGTNNYTGNTTLSSGKLQLGNNAALGVGGTLVVNGGTLSSNNTTARSLANSVTFNNDVTIGDATNTGGLSFSASNLVTGIRTITVLASNSLTLSGGLADNGVTSGIIKEGAGTLGLGTGQSPSLSGGITLNGGQLNVGNTQAIGTGTFTIGNNGVSIDNISAGPKTLSTNNVQNWNGDFTFVGSQASRELNLGTGAVTLGGNRQVTVSASTLTVGGAIGDTGAGRSLTKLGAGTLVLAGANTYTGATTINGGTLQIGGTGGAGTTAGATGSLSNLSTITNNGTLAFNRTGTITQGTDFAAGISGSGNVTQIGTGTTVLGGTNSYNGGTAINAGTLIFLTTTAKPATGTVTVASAATMGLGVATSGSFFSSADVDSLFAGTLTGVTNNAASNVGIDTSAGDFTYSTTVSSTRGLVKLGANTLTLSGTGTYDGTTTVAAGTLKLGNATGLGTTATVTSVASGAALDLNGQTIGAEGVTLNGTGVSSGGALINSNTGTPASLSGLVTLTSASSVGGAGSFTLSGGLAGLFDFSKVGAGTVALTAASATRSTAAATAQINGGVLSVQNNTALGTNGTANTIFVTINSGGTLELAGGITLDNGLSLNLQSGGVIRSSGSNTTNGRINVGTAAATSVTVSTVGASDVFTVGNGSNDFTGGASDSVVHISGPGTVLLTNLSPYLGKVSVDAGTLKLGATASLGAATTANLLFGASSTGKLQLNGISPTVIGLNTNATIGTPIIENGLAGTATLADNTTGADTYAGVLQNGAAGTLSLTKSGIGSLTLSGANTYTGTTTITGGTLTISNPGSTTNGTTNNALGGSGISMITSATSILQLRNDGAGGTGAGVVSYGNTFTSSQSGVTIDVNNVTGAVTNKTLQLGAATLATITLNVTGGNAYSLGFTGLTMTTANGTTFNPTTANVVLGTVTNSISSGGPSNLTLDGTSSGNSVAGAISNNGAFLTKVTKSGSSTWTLSGINGYSGGTTLSSGTLILGNKDAIGTGTLTLGGGLLSASATLTGANKITNAMTMTGNVSTAASSLEIELGGNLDLGGALKQITVNNTTGVTFSGVISNDGAGGLRIISTGPVTLGGLNTFTGTMEFRGASPVSVSNIGIGGVAGNLGKGSTIKLGSGNGTASNLRYTGSGETTDRTIDLATTDGAISIEQAGTGVLEFTNALTATGVGSKTLTLQGSNTGSGKLGGAIVDNNTGGGLITSVTKAGTNTWTLSGPVTYTGATTVSAGTLVAGASSLVSTAGAFGNAATAIVLGDASTTTNNSSPSLLIGGAFTVRRDVTVASRNTNGTYTIGGNTADSSIFSGAIALNRNLTVTAITGGTVNLTKSISNASGTNTVNVTGAGTSNVILNNGTANQFAPTAFAVNSGKLSLGASNQIANATNLTVAGGTLDIGANSDTVGAVSLTSGSITGSGGTLTSASAYDMQAGSVSAILGGSVGLNKTTSGTVILSGSNTYTGPTNVTGGTLEISGSIGGATGTAISVSGGSLLLSGAGPDRITTGFTVTLAGGTLGFVDGLNSLSETLDSLTLSATSTLDFGDGHSNTLALNGGITGLGIDPGEYSLAVWNWSLSQDHLALNATLGPEELGQIRFYSDEGGTLLGTGEQISFGTPTYEIVPVPEPSSMALLGAMGLLGLVGYRERRRFCGLANR